VAVIKRFLANPDRLLLAATLVLCAIFLSPILKLGYIGDDIYNSFVNGWMFYNHKNLVDAFTNVAGLWIHKEGRFFPVGMIYGILFWHFFPSQSVEKVVQLAAIIVNVATFAVFAAALGKSRQLGTLAALIALVTFEIRNWYDGMIAYFIVVPVALELALLSAYFMLRWLEAPDRKRYLAGSLLACALGFLTYELTYALALVNLYLCLRRSRDRKTLFVGFGSTLALIAGFVIFDLALRAAAHMSGQGEFSISPQPGPWARAAFFQAIGALPLDYAASRLIWPGLVISSAVSVYVAIIVLVLAPIVVRRVISSRPNQILDLLVVGVLFWIPPAVMLALSPRWQAELGPGLAYIAVYIEYYGVALVLSALCVALFRVVGGHRVSSVLATLAFTIAVSLGLYLTAHSNERVVTELLPLRNARTTLEDAFRSGLSDPAPDGSLIVLDGSYVFNFGDEPTAPNAKYLLAQVTGRRFAVQSEASLDGAILCAGPIIRGTCRVKSNVFRYRNLVSDASKMWIQLAHVTELQGAGGEASRTLMDTARVYATGFMRERALASGAQQIRAFPGGAALFAFRGCPMISDNLLVAARPDFVYGGGFYGPESFRNDEFEWMGRHGTITLVNPFDVARRFQYDLAIAALSNTQALFRFGKEQRRVDTGPDGTRLRFSVQLPPRGTMILRFDVPQGTFHVPGDPRELGLRISAPKPDLRVCGASGID